MSGPIRMRPTEEGEVMLTLPNGEVKFLGFWEGLWVAWVAIFQGKEVIVDD